ncbi:MAG: tetratricopeptide repeat protein [Gallionellaceae bacterium]|nr:MAG: tetratricopeptide repeat protein [Gallionellaceae bacterium]
MSYPDAALRESQINRNDPCPCGSGKKYKKCCMDKPAGSAQVAAHAIQTGLAHHQAGRLEQAYDAYQQALRADPKHPDALHLLGMLAHQIGDSALALELIDLAINVQPNSSVFHSNLGNVLQSQGQHEEAIASFRQALALDSGNAMFHYNLGQALQTHGQLQDAASSYRQAITLAPQHVEAHSNLGHTLRALGELEQAVASYRRATDIAPNLAEMHFNLGAALNAQGQADAAIACYRHAIALFADYAQAHCNLGVALLGKGDFDAAVASYRRALDIDPGLADAHYNLGIALQAQNQLDAAIASYRRALELQPEFAEGYCNLGNALRAQGQLDAAVACYQKALALKPDYANAYSNLLFLLSYHAIVPPAEYLEQACGWEHACVSPQLGQAAHEKSFARLPLAGRRLKVGYVSGDFRKHATSYFIEQIFAQHDRTRVELFAYSNNRARDAVTERLHALVEHWTPIAGMTDAAVCARMAADGIDVLIDLAGHSANNRLGVFARRAAPVQATYLYFASTGLTEMDYWIGDEILTPPEMDDQFNERVWRLPRTWLSYKTIADAPATHWQPASDGSIRLGSFNNLGKITPQTLKLWTQLLHALPTGRLLLKNKDLADAGNRQRILSELAAHGIGAERVDLRPGSDWANYMAEHDRLDIALDPVGGHGGGTSTCDALWMGVPVITLLGDHVGSRFAASLVNAIGHSEWIAHSEAEYIAKTVALAQDVELRKRLRFAQREQMAHSPLCDARGLAHALEDAYCSMFRHWLTTQPLNPVGASHARERKEQSHAGRALTLAELPDGQSS